VGCFQQCDGLDESTCSANPECHPVYKQVDSGVSAIVYLDCATGLKATCTATVTCASAPPTCGGMLVTSYANGCYEGCVYASECP
jgi:hypothetical protein